MSTFMATAWSEIKYLATKELLSLILTTKRKQLFQKELLASLGFERESSE